MTTDDTKDINSRRAIDALEHKDQARAVTDRCADQRVEPAKRTFLERMFAALDYKDQTRGDNGTRHADIENEEALSNNNSNNQRSVIPLVTSVVLVDDNGRTLSSLNHFLCQRSRFVLAGLFVAVCVGLGVPCGLGYCDGKSSATQTVRGEPVVPQLPTNMPVVSPSTAPTTLAPSYSPSQSPTTIPFLNSSAWFQTGQVLDGETTGDELGYHVDISADGRIVATRDRDYFEHGTGRVLVYQYNSTVDRWQLLGQPIVGEFGSESFGYSIALSPDGTTIAAGSIYNEKRGENSGSLRVYSLFPSVVPFGASPAVQWTLRGQEIPGSRPGDEFGSSVALSLDGRVVAVGAAVALGYVGEIRVFEFVEGNFWQQMGQTVVGSAEHQGQFGTAVALSSDGQTFATVSRRSFGPAYVYSFNRTLNMWTDISFGVQLGDDDETTSRYVWSLDMSADGRVLAVGYEPGFKGGNVGVFQYSDERLEWIQLGQTLSSSSNSSVNSFGISVSLSAAGDVLAVGDDSNGEHASSAGHVQVYSYEPLSAVWSPIGGDSGGIYGRAKSDYFGRGVALSSDGEHLVVGAYGSDHAGSRFGQVRVFGRTLDSER